ncbi:MAG TPA: hypothetical protein VN682_11935 [Terriglobales bacterium]|nr:hypothetical protein [Terriglobales bacterium]
MEFDSQHRLIARHSATDAGTIDYEYSYDPVTGFLSAIRSSNGQKQSFSYDANGNLRSAVLPTGEIGFKFSERGDLLSISENQQSATFAPAAGGLFASMTTSPKSVTKLQYNSANELREITFPGGVKSSFTYEPSGLRSSLALSSGGGAEYSYDPAGNLTESKVFDKKHKQTNGQKLEMDSAYQLTRWTLFDGTVTEFKYDPSGNLTEIKKGSSLTRFEYDEINRLIAVITPDGQRLTYAYKPGERSLIEQHQHAAVSVEDLRDTGLTFSSSLQVSATRSVTGLLGAVRFSETLGTFQLSGSDGTDVVEPHERFITALSNCSCLTPICRPIHSGSGSIFLLTQSSCRLSTPVSIVVQSAPSVRRCAILASRRHHQTQLLTFKYPSEWR